MDVKITRCHPEATLPRPAIDGAACLDLCAVDLIEPISVSDGRPALIRTGIKVEVPEDHALLIFSRSGHGFKSDVRLANAVGVIDPKYIGEVMVKLTKDGPGAYTIAPGERIAQAMLIKTEAINWVEVDALAPTERGEGGFGSTGTTDIASE